MKIVSSLLAAAPLSLFTLLASPAEAQTTWTVKFGGGPGIDFTSLPIAVDFAQDGDTILVFGFSSVGATPFTTGKALTIIGVNGAEPIGSQPSNPFVIQGLPADKVFRMSGFNRFEGALDIQIRDCQGLVILEDIIADEPSFGFPTSASMQIQNSESVVLRRVTNFGSPALDIQNSRVLLSQCLLSGGGALLVNNSSLLSVASRYLTGGPGLNCITATSSTLEFTGDGGAVGLPLPSAGGLQEIDAQFDSKPPLNLTQSLMVVDPKIPVKAGFAQPLLTGDGTLAIEPVSGVWNGKATVGNPLQFSLVGAPSSTAFLAIGSPTTFSDLPLGVLAVDLLAPYAFLPAVGLSGAGVANITVTVPNTIPPRTTFCAQGLFVGQALELGLPSIFLVH